MRIGFQFGIAVGLSTFALLGCEEGPRHRPTAQAPAAVPVTAVPAHAAPASAMPATAAPARVAASAAATTPAPVATATTPEVASSEATATNQATADTVREEAAAGAGEKGRTLKYELGTTAAKTYFAARERVVFEIQIPSAMQLYKATNGAAPKDQEAFMRDIVTANAIVLPELPAGHKYVYDAKLEELQVEHPRGQ